MVFNDWLGTISAIAGVVVGFFIQYWIGILKEKKTLKENLIRAFNSHLSAMDKLVWFTDDLEHYVAGKTLESKYDILFFDSLEKVETAWELYGRKDKKINNYWSKWIKLRDMLIDSYGHSLGNPGKEARIKAHNIHKNVRKFYSELKQDVLR